MKKCVAQQDLTIEESLQQYFPSILHSVDAGDDQTKLVVEAGTFGVYDAHGTFLHRFKYVGLRSGQSGVPDWTCVLQDWSHYCSIKVQQVSGWCTGSLQLLEKVQTRRCF